MSGGTGASFTLPWRGEVVPRSGAGWGGVRGDDGSAAVRNLLAPTRIASLATSPWQGEVKG